MANHGNWGIFKPFIWHKNIFLASEVSPFYVTMHCIPRCCPELGVSLAVEGMLSLLGVLCSSVASAPVVYNVGELFGWSELV